MEWIDGSKWNYENVMNGVPEKGNNLMTYINTCGPKNERGRFCGLYFDDTAKVLVQVALGLAHLHRSGIIHRDIKASNVLVGESLDHVVLADYGAVTKPREEELDTAGFRLSRSLSSDQGTVNFRAPELVFAEELGEGHAIYNANVDVFGMGVLLYLMVTGRIPQNDAVTLCMFSDHHTEGIFPGEAEAHVELPLELLKNEMWVSAAKVPADCQGQWRSSDEMRRLAKMTAMMLKVDPNERISIRKFLAAKVLNRHAKQFANMAHVSLQLHADLQAASPIPFLND